MAVMPEHAQPAGKVMAGEPHFGSVERQAYADTASIAFAARRDLSISDTASPPPVCPAGVALFFAPNATRCLAAIVEFMVRHRRCSLGPWRKGDVHPVVEHALTPLTGIPGMRRLHLHTAMDWVTGAYRGLRPETAPGDLAVIDAVQCFGNLEPEELEDAWQAVRDGAVVVGCIHKWVGSAVPMGFAALAVGLLEEDQELRGWLAAQDYLGDAVGDRPGFDRFPDTYSRSLAPVVRRPLRLAFGNNARGLSSLVSIIRENRTIMRELLAQSAHEPAVREPTDDCRGMIALRGEGEGLARLSARLFRESFVHTVLQANGGDALMRLSAPTVPVAPAIWARFKASL